MNFKNRLLLCAALFAVAGLTACPGTDPECGDGTPEGEARCDTRVCGDGTVDSNEQCDDGNTTSGDGCSATCQTESTGPVCGNGTKEGTEACDDGNQTAGDGCENDCTESPVCGDGVKEGVEQCDDGNKIAADGCENDCSLSVAACGNGVEEGLEECDDGNQTEGDGCENDCTNTPLSVEVCPGTIAPPSSGTCAVTTGDANRLFSGTVLTPYKVLKNGQVLVDSAGVIQCVGCDCSATAGAATATKVECASGIVTASLVNAHDHITFQADPFVPTTDERYEHRHDWRIGHDGHSKISNGGSATGDQIIWGELRNIMAGTTSIAGSGGAKGLLRNADAPSTHTTSDSQEGLGLSAAVYATFPLGDTSGTELTSSCAYPSTPSAPTNAQWLPHIAEGIEDSARNEMLCLTGVGTGATSAVGANTGIIHGIGVKAPDIARLSALGSKLIWSPRSNISLYGDTAPVAMYRRLGVPIALGTDWVRSGSMNILRELRCAEYLNSNHYGNVLTDQELWLAVTLNAARALGIDSKTGSLETGKVADIAVFSGNPDDPFMSIIGADPEDVVLTVRGGKVLYGDDALVQALSTDACDVLDVCSVSKAVCLQSEIGRNLATLQAANATTYPLFTCGGDPAKEPTCLPARSALWTVNGSTSYAGAVSSTDDDGDGVPNGMDNCRGVFNPIRPLDNGAQADNDSDGLGDVCDVCPLDANTTTCSPIMPNDADADGIADTADNCPADPNAGQEDADQDGTGDVCDFCAAPNPNNSACPATVYDVKTPDGAGNYLFVNRPVLIAAGQVTARFATGFFMQVPASDPSYTGPDYSGLYVYNPSNTVAVGDIVSVSGQVQNYFGQIQLSNVSAVNVTSSGNAAPAPVVATSAELSSAIQRGAKLEGVLVTVQNVTVTNTAPAPGPADSATPNEFEVTSTGASSGVRVNDLLYLLTPFAMTGEVFTSITGPLDWRNGNFKIEPRDATDIVSGGPSLVTFGPASSFTRVGQSGPSFPGPLTVGIARPQATDTVIAVTSGSADLTVDNAGQVTIPAGQTTAVVPVTGVTQNTAVTLTAALNGVTRTADVRVLGVAEVPSVVTVSPASTTVQPAGTVDLTVSLDIPAPAGGTTVAVTLSNITDFSAPATVNVPQDQLSATLTVSATAAATGSVTVTVALGASTSSSTITVQVGRTGLVINEVDYDQPATDTAEFVELFNSSAAPISLTGISVVLVNGNGNADYKQYDLSSLGSLAAGEYLVIGASTVLTGLPGTVKTLALDTGAGIQNGAPDAVALVDMTANALIDALSYEDGTASGMTWLRNGTTFNLREGGTTANLIDSGTAAGSLQRTPNGMDTDNNAVDFVFAATPTPGAAN